MDLGPARVAEIDASGMLAQVAGLAAQLREGYADARAQLSERIVGPSSVAPRDQPDGLVACGMGGSAIGADRVLAGLPGITVPAAVVRGYDRPEWVGPRTLVIAVSYSGETEETLACATRAGARGCAPACIASGGSLAALAEAEGLPWVRVPGGGQPRAAVGRLSMALLAALEAARLTGRHDEEVAQAAAQLEADDALLAPGRPDTDNAAKRLARTLEQRLVVVYGAGPTVPVARRWKGQVNENAKAPAFFNELPELDHNEIMGWTSLPHVASSAVALFLTDVAAGERLGRRADLTAREYERLGVTSEVIAARGSSRLARLFSLVQLGDYVSCYLALLYGMDPTPVDAIEAFKAGLSDPAG